MAECLRLMSHTIKVNFSGRNYVGTIKGTKCGVFVLLLGLTEHWELNCLYICIQKLRWVILSFRSVARKGKPMGYG